MAKTVRINLDKLRSVQDPSKEIDVTDVISATQKITDVEAEQIEMKKELKKTKALMFLMG